jgi:hypothetical protein
VADAAYIRIFFSAFRQIGIALHEAHEIWTADDGVGRWV